MMHDPLVDKFREHKAWKIKVKRAKARKLKDKVARLMKNEPQYTLTHLVKERYPTFMDAIRDLDDAVTMIHLFMLMPTKTVKPSTFPPSRPLLQASCTPSQPSLPFFPILLPANLPLSLFLPLSLAISSLQSASKTAVVSLSSSSTSSSAPRLSARFSSPSRVSTSKPSFSAKPSPGSSPTVSTKRLPTMSTTLS